MNTKDEIVYFCNELHPVGALMLTGEWGCGKTYLIEHDVKKELSDTHIIVRISLFGISSIDEFNKVVKKRWVDECAPFFKAGDDEGLIPVGKTIVSILGKIGKTVTPGSEIIAETALSINPFDFVKIKPIISGGNKHVVLVFDDLERSKLNTTDILGCINEYCENLEFLVIIVANENIITKQIKKGNTTAEPQNFTKIELDCPGKRISNGTIGDKNNSTVSIINIKCTDPKDDRLGLSYGEIKEKIVCRTVEYIPDYTSIIKSIINSDDSGFGIEYRGFLKNIEDRIVQLFEYELDLEANTEIMDDEKKSQNRPKNLRSLKCALHDFMRIYKILESNNVSNKEIGDNCIAFIAFTLATKANLIDENDIYGYIFAYDTLEDLYPFINRNALYNSEKDWIVCNTWDENQLKQEIEERINIKKKQEIAKEPKEILKVSRLFDIDDEDLQNGFDLLLEDCYSGKLNFNDYVQFICNAMNMRKYKFPQYERIKWEKVMEGINKKIESIIKGDDDTDVVNDNKLILRITSDYINHFTEKEMRAYDVISQFIDFGGINFEQNRKIYLKTIKDNSIDAFVFSDSKRFDRFDEEMAIETIECYKRCSQPDRNAFPSYFSGLFGSLDREKFFKRKETVSGLGKLLRLLDDLRVDYEQSGKMIAKTKLEQFVEDIKRLRKKYQPSESNSTNSNNYANNAESEGS